MNIAMYLFRIVDVLEIVVAEIVLKKITINESRF